MDEEWVGEIDKGVEEQECKTRLGITEETHQIACVLASSLITKKTIKNTYTS